MKRLPGRLLIGGVITMLLIGAAVVSRFWTPADPAAINIVNRLKGPGPGGLLGADQLGRDEFSMIMAGAWTSLSIAITGVALGAILGVAIGAEAAARRGRFEAVTMRIADVLFSFPPVLSALLIAAVLGGGPQTTIVAIALFMVPVFARVTRGAALQARARDYVLAARMAGLSDFRITLGHVLPDIAGQIIVQLAIQTGLAILTEAGLSFLGLGVPPPTPSWGRMLADARTYLSAAPHLVLAPGLAITLAVLGFNLLGDGLSRALDPRRREGE
ncbi:ABC transporter permease [Martelella endophytica]|uniref:Peptide ABC transporter permease n=1 Tax=Martelella endophytica TaxID=1486262 RepID=A0A0D5LUH8_MAREN|nr:ABC transporter permease [Martelella endophytica]AJY47726.1 peptide ABC transporter permease [Martelella endophytica]